MTTFTQSTPTFTGVFGGTVKSGNDYTFPSSAESWAGFSNDDTTIYPLNFSNAGKITFDYVSSSSASLYFRIEDQPHPNVSVNFNTISYTVNGTGSGEVTINSQGVTGFNSLLLYLETTDVTITLTNIIVFSDLTSVNPITWNGLTWNFETTSGNNTWPYNNELQGYDGTHVTVVNNTLQINMEKVIDNGTTLYKSSRIYSLSDNDNLKLGPGRKLSIEFEAKMPTAYDSNGNELTGVPLWPALWMMGTGQWDDAANQAWPNCGEIDVMEWSPANGNKIHTAAIHYSNSSNAHEYQSNTYTNSTDLNVNFHKYKTIIYYHTNEDPEIEMYFDDTLIHTYTLDDSKYSELYQVVQNGTTTSNSKEYGIIINLAMGGNYTSNVAVDALFDNAIFEINSIDIDRSFITPPLYFEMIWTAFGGTGYDITSNTFSFPNSADSWGGFANLDTNDIYPLTFSTAGKIEFDYQVISGTNVNVYIELENMPYPDNTIIETINNNLSLQSGESGHITMDINIGSTQTFKNLILKLSPQNSVIIIENFRLYSDQTAVITSSLLNIHLNGEKNMTLAVDELTKFHTFNPLNVYDQVLGAYAYDISSNPNPTISAEFLDTADPLNPFYDLTLINDVGNYEIIYTAHGADGDSVDISRVITVIDNALEIHSVQFDNTNVDVDVLALGDLSTNLSKHFTFKDIFYQEGFDFTDSSAVAEINISKTKLNNPGLFKLNIPFSTKTSNGGVNMDLDQVRYFTDVSGWPDISFSEATVKIHNMNSYHHDQTVKKDFTRSMMKDIMGTTRINRLFTNQKNVLNEIQDVDVSFNDQIREILGDITNAGFLTDEDYGAYQSGSQNYAFTSNKYISYGISQEDISSGYHALQSSKFSAFNPLRILSSSILGERDADETDNYDISGDPDGGLGNTTRRAILIEDLSGQTNLFWNIHRNTRFFGFKDTSYNVWLENNTEAQSVDASMVDGAMFSRYLNDVKLYVEEATDASGLDLIEEVVDKKYDFNFLAGDNLHLIVEYDPPINQFTLLNPNTTVRNRKYEVILKIV
jgi:hypothetical protein